MSNTGTNNSTNNLKATDMRTKFNFLENGFYDIMEVTEEIVDGKRSYPAKVRRWESSLLKSGWKNETVNLVYLYTAESNGPKLKFADPSKLINHVIEITERITHQSTSGKAYHSYNWKVDERSTAGIQEQVQENIQEFADMDYQLDLEDYEFMLEFEEQTFIGQQEATINEID